jgi:hypothetical protein
VIAVEMVSLRHDSVGEQYGKRISRSGGYRFQVSSGADRGAVIRLFNLHNGFL